MIWGRHTSCCMMSSLAAEDGLQHNTCMFNAQDSMKGPDASTSVSILAQVRTIGIAMGCSASCMKGFSACTMTVIARRDRWLFAG